MENIYEISLLMDFYGQLITERQYQILDLHYNNDYSFGEIAELLNISRQGVYDNVKKGKKLLGEFEEKLGLVGKFLVQKGKTEDALKYVNQLKTDNLTEDDRESLERIKEILGEISNII